MEMVLKVALDVTLKRRVEIAPSIGVEIALV